MYNESSGCSRIPAAPVTAAAPLTRAAIDVLRICEVLGLRACVIGGMAVQRWGQPRATHDVDLTVLADLKEDPDLLAPFEAAWRQRLV
jgi:hypothetical protein